MRTTPTEHTIDPRLILQRELERRCQSNPRYSLRAFAKALGMSPTALSFVLNGKRPLSKKATEKAVNTLSLSQEECALFLKWSQTRKTLARNQTKNLAAHPNEANSYQLSLDSFSFISDWYHYAILSLLEIPRSRFEAKWISRHLGITETEARGAMDRLQRMEIVEKIDGRWKQCTGPIRIGNDVPTAATKRFQKQLLLKAIDSVDNDPVEVRDFSSMTIAMDSSLIPYAREEIRKFRRRLAEDLETMGKPERVYKFTVQIFPVSRPLDKKENSK